MCPNTCNTCNKCIDGIARFKLIWNSRKITRDCVWVGNKQTQRRCNVPGISDTCRVVCDFPVEIDYIPS